MFQIIGAVEASVTLRAGILMVRGVVDMLLPRTDTPKTFFT